MVTTRNWLAACVLLVASAASAFAQGEQARFAGTVRDQSGGYFAGAKVTAKNERTGEERTAESNDKGFYLIVNRMVEYAWPNILYHLVDWEAANDEVRTALLGALVEHGRLPAIGAWSGDMTDAERQLLTDSGFEDAELDLRHRGMPCGLLKSIGATAPRPLTADGAQWDIRLLDTMHG